MIQAQSKKELTITLEDSGLGSRIGKKGPSKLRQKENGERSGAGTKTHHPGLTARGQLTGKGVRRIEGREMQKGKRKLNGVGIRVG